MPSEGDGSSNPKGQAMSQATETLDTEPMPTDERQYPSRQSVEWNNPDWRQRFLGNRTDAELDAMSPRWKGAALYAYVWRDGYEYYGLQALHYIRAINILADAQIAHEKLSPAELIRMGQVVSHGRLS